MKLDLKVGTVEGLFIFDWPSVLCQSTSFIGHFWALFCYLKGPSSAVVLNLWVVTSLGGKGESNGHCTRVRAGATDRSHLQLCLTLHNAITIPSICPDSIREGRLHSMGRFDSGPPQPERAGCVSVLPAEKSRRRKSTDLGNAEAEPSIHSTSGLCLLPEPFGGPRTR